MQSRLKDLLIYLGALGLVLIIFLPVIYITAIAVGAITTTIFNIHTVGVCDVHHPVGFFGWCFVMGFIIELMIVPIMMMVMLGLIVWKR